MQTLLTESKGEPEPAETINLLEEVVVAGEGVEEMTEETAP